jgi:hypothetical protein
MAFIRKNSITCIFIVSLCFVANSTVPTKVAPHVKIPYVKNMLNAFRQKAKSYEYTQNIIYRIASEEYVSYFYVKKDLINYYRQSVRNEGVLIPNTKYNTYDFVEFNKSAQYTRRPLTLLTKSLEGKWRIIVIKTENDSKEHGMIITSDEVNGNVNITPIKWDIGTSKDIRQLDFLSDYPFCRDTFVILRITTSNIILHFLNLSENGFDSILWGLDDINQIVFDIIKNADEDEINKAVFGTISSNITFDVTENLEVIELKKAELYNDNIIRIDFIAARGTHYLYSSCSNNKMYLHSVNFYFRLYLRGNRYNYVIEDLGICITKEEGRLKCYWDFSDAKIGLLNLQNQLQSYQAIPCKKYLGNTILFVKNYVTNLEKYCNCDLHNQDCYYLKYVQGKHEIVKTGIWLETCQVTCIEDYALYPYKNYYIAIYKNSPIKLAIIDKEHNFIAVVMKLQFFPQALRPLVNFKYYHSLLGEKLVFLSNNLQHLFFINTKKIDKILSAKHNHRCQDIEHENYYKDLAHYFYMPDQILLAIKNAHSVAHNEITINILGSYIDDKSDVLYIAAEYKMQNEEYYGVFTWNMASNSLDFSLLHTIPANKAYCRAKNKRRHIFDLSKLTLWESELYNFAKIKLIGSDIAYSENHRFISIKYNRFSRYIPVPNLFQFENYPCEVKNIKNVTEGLVVVYYDCSRSYPNAITNAYHYFITLSTPLVKSIPTIRI